MKIGAKERDQLMDAARSVQKHAHAPYSRFAVGAALLSESGRIYAGCNVENASYGATLCAEQSAVAAMVAAGERRALALAVVTDGQQPAYPCGICRQVLAEFAADMPVFAEARGKQRDTQLAALLPERFSLEP